MSRLLWEGNPPGWLPGNNPELPQITIYPVSGRQSDCAIIVFPGGGYNQRALHEGEPVAHWLNQLGISAFVVDYRVAPEVKYPYPMMDGARAVRYVRFHAAEWGINPGKIGVLGFSAGGHLAAATGIKFENGDPEVRDPLEQVSSRPDLMVLCYPVISFGECCHAGSVRNLLGENPSEELIKLMSLQFQVTSQTPPAFIWHTANDASVPVENALMMAGSLSKAKVPFELHIFEEGRHGLGLAAESPEVAGWKDLCACWLGKKGFGLRSLSSGANHLTT